MKDKLLMTDYRHWMHVTVSRFTKNGRFCCTDIKICNL